MYVSPSATIQEHGVSFFIPSRFLMAVTDETSHKYFVENCIKISIIFSVSVGIVPKSTDFLVPLFHKEKNICFISS